MNNDASKSSILHTTGTPRILGATCVTLRTLGLILLIALWLCPVHLWSPDSNRYNSDTLFTDFAFAGEAGTPGTILGQTPGWGLLSGINGGAIGRSNHYICGHQAIGAYNGIAFVMGAVWTPPSTLCMEIISPA